jgi:hypothetical protein
MGFSARNEPFILSVQPYAEVSFIRANKLLLLLIDQVELRALPFMGLEHHHLPQQMEYGAF